MTPHKHHDLIVAWVKGATIQYKDKDWDDWVGFYVAVPTG